MDVNTEKDTSQNPSENADGCPWSDPMPSAPLYVRRKVVDHSKDQKQQCKNKSPTDCFSQKDQYDRNEMRVNVCFGPLPDIVSPEQAAEHQGDEDRKQNRNPNS